MKRMRQSELKHYRPEVVVLRPEGLETALGQLVPVCSECGERLEFYGFGCGAVHWTCGCSIEQEGKRIA